MTQVFTLDELGANLSGGIAEIRDSGQAALITGDGKFLAAVIPFQDQDQAPELLAVTTLDELRRTIAEGRQSAPAEPADEAYFSGLRDHAEARARVQAVIDRYRVRLLPEMFRAWLNGLDDRRIALLAENWGEVMLAAARELDD